MPSASATRCPTCGAKADAGHRPFCSRRCARTDLGRWLSGQYAIPSGEEPDSADIAALEEAMNEAVAEGRVVPGDFPRK